MLLLLALTACASGSLLSDVARAAFLNETSPASVDALNGPLNPKYQYLRVELDGKAPALLVLGYLDAHPQGDIEVWYSASGEVLRLQNGRIVGATGLAVDWRQMNFPQPPPAWVAVPPGGANFSRVRDESPAYRAGLYEQVSLAPVTSPPTLKLTHDRSKVQVWFRETYSTANGASLPEAWFALGVHQGQKTIVYSRQCLAADLCLTIQRWPLEKDPS